MGENLDLFQERIEELSGENERLKRRNLQNREKQEALSDELADSAL